MKHEVLRLVRWPRRVVSAVLLGAVVVQPAFAQPSLSIDDAMRRAREQHPSVRAAMAAEREARHRVTEAASGALPRVDVSQAWQRGNQPVFVFGSLLAQRRFAAPNFAIDTVNRPDAIDNHRTAFTVDQVLFDGGRTRLSAEGARLQQRLAEVGTARTGQDLALVAARAYASVARLEAHEVAAGRIVGAAESAVTLARERRDAGVATEADVLSAAVDLAGARAGLVETTAELLVARVELNEAMGAPLDERYSVSLGTREAAPTDVSTLEREALEGRHEVRAAALGLEVARNGRDVANAVLRPQIGVQGAVEMNGHTPVGETPSWALGVEVRLNLFRGFADTARRAAAREGEARRQAERDSVTRRIRLDVRSAVARLDSARARVDVGLAAVAQARESLRITRDRYEDGRVTMNDLLQATRALSQAESDAIASRVDVVLRSIELDRAVGRL